MKNFKLLIALALIGSSYGMIEAKNIIFCLKEPVFDLEDRDLRCSSHFDRKTKDKYHCYIRFDVDGKDIQLVVDKRDPSRVVPDELYGASHDLFDESAVATYEKKTPEGNYPQALLFNRNSNVNVPALVADTISAQGLADAVGATLQVLANTPENLAKVRAGFGTPFADCALPSK